MSEDQAVENAGGTGTPRAWLLPFLSLSGVAAAIGTVLLIASGQKKQAILPGLLALGAFSAWSALRSDRILHDRVHGTIRTLGPAGWLALVWLSVPALGSIALLAFFPAIGGWLTDRGSMAVVIYIAAFTLLAGVGLLPTYLQAALGGWSLALFPGIPAALLGFTGAAVVGYWISHMVSRDRVERILREEPRWLAVRDALIGEGFWRTLLIVALVRVPPSSPFAATNLVLSSSGTPLFSYALGTLIGMTPRTAAAVYIGHEIRLAGGEMAGSGGGWLRLVLSVVAAVVAVVVIGRVSKRALARVADIESGATVTATDSLDA